MELYERLTELRKKNGLSQEKLAELLNISRQAVSKWETGTSNPDINNIIQLGKLYGVSTDYILLGKVQEAESPEHSDHPAEKPPAETKIQANWFLWHICVTSAFLQFYTRHPVDRKNIQSFHRSKNGSYHLHLSLPYIHSTHSPHRKHNCCTNHNRCSSYPRFCFNRIFWHIQ